MKYTQLGRTGLKVSRLALGTMNFGQQTNEADTQAIMDAARDAGINFFDTANVYGWGENKGRTESVIGNWITKGGERATRSSSPPRCTATWPPTASPGPTTTNSPAVNIRRAVDASLRRLQTNYIAYRTSDRLSAALAAGMPPKTLRTWRAAIAARTPWTAAVPESARAEQLTGPPRP